MKFEDALKTLGIEKYSKRIFNSNSHGELFHLQQYFVLAKVIKDSTLFSAWFEFIVKEAEDKWERPESIFQHIGRIFIEQIDECEKDM